VLARETVPPYTADQVAVDRAALCFAVMADKEVELYSFYPLSKHRCDQRKHSTMSPMIPAFALVLAQATQPNPPSKSHEWCFERGNGAQLCEETQAACIDLRRINTEIATSECKHVEPPEIQVSPTEPPAPPSPEKQTPTQR
jgi:hypothetical protein